jgi:L-cysteine S-thiosulfotransferase
MRRGEKVILAIIAGTVLILAVRNLVEDEPSKDKGIPYYSTASAQLSREASSLYEKNNCSDCHSLWTVRNMLEFVPAPILDGIGSLHDEDWFYRYFSATDPQKILPSRLKKQYRMPSFAALPEHDRRVLASYMASLKVKDWYLEATRKAEYEKLTGKQYHP